MIVTAISLTLVIVIILGVVVLVLALLYFSYYYLGQRRQAQLFSDYIVPPPPTLVAPMPVVYHVELTYNRGGRRIIEPWEGAELTFRVSGDAKVNGATEIAVTTDINGNAFVTLTPERTGSGELNLHLKVGASEEDEQPRQFETFVP